MDTQKTLISQRNLEKEKRSWRNQTPRLQIMLQGYSNQDSMVLAQNRNIDQWNRIENLTHMVTLSLTKEARIYNEIGRAHV